MEFQERIEKGFQMALRTGVDEIFSIGSVLVKMGQGMAQQAQKTKPSLSMLHPAVLPRLGQAWLRCKIAKRPMLPRDLWPAKAIMTAGTDTAIYKDDIAYYWGRMPYEFYGSTEVACMALQCWNKKGMTFLPDVAFWEFIPEEERQKSKENEEYQPSTVLLDEVEEGRVYELVLTQFYRMPLLRYRIGDIITIVALRDEEVEINLPQIVFKTRVGETIDLAGLTELDEKTIWRAISDTGVKYEDWAACKEYDQGQTYLRLYLELKESREAPEMERLIDEQLKVVDEDYRDMDALLGLQPVRVTLLSRGTFQRYYDQKRREGADLAHLKPPHMNAPDTIIQRLLQLSQQDEG
jgi:phenylacetate-coenzyme A ligase PaaK-like adenylate-forming protein